MLLELLMHLMQTTPIYTPLLSIVKLFSLFFPLINVAHVKRITNVSTHTLVKYVLSSIEDCPLCINSCIADDLVK